MTADLAPLTHDEAERLTERIRTALDRVATAWSDLAERVTEAFERRADKALGYASWAEYAEAELKPSSALAVEVRRELVGLLSAQGMSTRAIAPAVGVSKDTVQRDQVSHHETPATDPRRENGRWKLGSLDATNQESLNSDWKNKVTQARDQADIDRHEEAVTAWQERQSAPVTGLDGKTYTRPEPRESFGQKDSAGPSKPRRRPITDAARDAGWELHRAVERIERVLEDERLTGKNKEQVATHLRGHLLTASESCQRLAQSLERE